MSIRFIKSQKYITYLYDTDISHLNKRLLVAVCKLFKIISVSRKYHFPTLENCRIFSLR
jgi:hypothetical protein